MAWEEELFALLDDLEQQAEALYDAERDAELADRSRAEYQQVTLASRLMASVDREVRLEVTGVGAVERRARAGRRRVVRAARAGARTGSSACRPSPRCTAPPTARCRRSPGHRSPGSALGSALRRLADAGERCVLHLRDGSRHDAVLRRVGADFVEVDRRRGPHRAGRLRALAAVQSRD